MIPEIGHFALILALCLAITQSVFPLVGTFTNTPSWVRMARPLSAGQLVFMGIAQPDRGDFEEYYARLRSKTEGLPSTVFVLAAEEIAFREVLLRYDHHMDRVE